MGSGAADAPELDGNFLAFLAWCRSRAIDVDEDALEFTFATTSSGERANTVDENRGVRARVGLSTSRTIARIPFDACLTPETCGMPDVARDVGEALTRMKTDASWLCALACALCVERHLGDASTFAPYDKVLPRYEKNVVSMWDDAERELLAGTEIEQSMRDELSAAKREWDRVVSKVFEKHGVKCSFDDFHAARTVVSSRAFTMTPSRNGLVPIADAFNHRTGEHDVNVGDGESYTGTKGDSLCVKITKTEGVREGDEIFNTYGFLGNAKLLNSYGFTQVNNPGDEVRLNTTNIRVAAAMTGISGGQLAKRFEWIGKAGVCAPDASFAFVRNGGIPNDIITVVWACVVDEDMFQKIRHTNRRADALEAMTTVAKSMSPQDAGTSSMMTPQVVDVIDHTVKRRLALYRDCSRMPLLDSTSSKRVGLAIALVEAERTILEEVLTELETFRTETGNKRVKASNDAFDLFD